ncbi:hypothetical protein [Sphingobium indicum]|uniref:Uncharacterized protein n=1 Tax=Sphingobium indicum (strain DSM 16412 / CCM 7286 / MTCC 6364 / B90A) TaxID=861109 RepID=A0A1L5BML0_SPHIB|nr:hypothetical protein [Sphingobium indicum]APL94125.1 hypothetical protein SIDU_06165 [Sphingobium indicum B90A]
MSMAEKVARLIAEELGDNYDSAFENKSEWTQSRGGEPFRNINMPYKGEYLEAARAVLKALREPTPAMVEAVERAARLGGIWSAKSAWQAMIDAALDGEG